MLQVRVAAAAEELLAGLAQELATPVGDPFAPEWVAVPTIGMRRWVTQRLADRLGASPGRADGIAANIDLPLPRELRRVVLAAGQPDGWTDPWSLDRVLWPVLEILERAADDPVLATLADVASGATLVGRGRRIADIFDRYSVHRPALLQRWERGENTGPDGAELAARHRWQPHLWRLLRSRIGQPSTAERWPDLLDSVHRDEVDLHLPPRIALFGLSALAPDLIELIEAVAAHREVTLHLLAPSPSLTAALRQPLPADKRFLERFRPPRAEVATAATAHHPLARSWAQPSGDAAVLLGQLDAVDASPVDPTPPVEPVTVLARLQDDIRADLTPRADLAVTSTDTSLRVHRCAGATRQVEVLRDALLHLLADDPTLTEGDIVVLTPSIERFAPLVDAVFGSTTASADRDAPALHYRISDRALRTRNPYLGAMAALLDLIGGRVTATELTEFLALDAVAERFGLDQDDLALIDDWIDEAGIRWGLDTNHRHEWGLPPTLTANTWRAGVDRLLVGSVLRDGDLVMGPNETVPVPVDGDEVLSVGRLAAALHAVTDAASALHEPRPLDEWLEALAKAAEDLLAVPRTADWQPQRLGALLDRLRDWSTSPAGASATTLALADIRRLLAEYLEGDPARAAFGTGAITVCSLRPLRSVPFRVVCLLGFDEDGNVAAARDGDDLMALAPCVGDRDPRAEARQLVLEAILSARDHVVITTTGSDVRTNQPVPEPVALAELWDALDATVVGDARSQLATDHPRQRFAPENFERSRPSFDRIALDAARALRTRGDGTGEAVPEAPLAPPEDGLVELADLHAVLAGAPAAFYRQRLGVRLPEVADGLTDILATELDALEIWEAGSRLLEARLLERSAQDWLHAEKAAGSLPPGSLGHVAEQTLTDGVEPLLDAIATHDLPSSFSDHHAIDQRLGSGTRLIGLVSDCAGPPRPGPVIYRFTRPSPAKTLHLWLDLLALTLEDPDADWRAVSIGRGLRANPLEIQLLIVRGDSGPNRAARADEALDTVVSLWREALSRPLPLFPRTSHALANDDRREARRHWGEETGMGERAKTFNRAAFGRVDQADLAPGASGLIPPIAADAERLAKRLWHAVGQSIDITVPDGTDARRRDR